MEVTRSTILGIAGITFAVAGFVLYTFMPDKVGLVSLCEGLALLCFALVLGMEFQQLKSFSARDAVSLATVRLIERAALASAAPQCSRKNASPRPVSP